MEVRHFLFLAAGFFLVARLTLDFLAITLFLSCGLTRPRHISFSEGTGIMLGGPVDVNDRSQFIWRHSWTDTPCGVANSNCLQ